MENRNQIITFFILCIFIISVISTIFSYLIYRYDKKNVNLEIYEKKNSIIITDNITILNKEDMYVIAKTYDISLYIKNNDIPCKIIMKVIDPSNNEYKKIPNLEYNDNYNGYDISNFNGIINIANNYQMNFKDKWQVKLYYIDYNGTYFLHPQFIIN